MYYRRPPKTGQEVMFVAAKVAADPQTLKVVMRAASLDTTQVVAGKSYHLVVDSWQPASIADHPTRDARLGEVGQENGIQVEGR